MSTAGTDADGGGVVEVIGLDGDEADGFDGDVFHEVAVAEEFLFVELDGEAFEDGVGDEGADGVEVLGGPGLLEGEEGGLDAGVEVRGVEGGVGFAEGLDGGFGVAFVDGGDGCGGGGGCGGAVPR